METEFCGFTLTPSFASRRSGIEESIEWNEYVANAFGVEAWHKEMQAVCCCRPTWADTGKCIWHADIDEKPVDALLETQGPPGERVDGALLNDVFLEAGYGQDISFAGRTLVGVDFTNTNLVKVDFSDAALRWVNLFGVYMREANFRGAEFFFVNISNTPGLNRADLSEITFRNGVISNVEFDKSDLSKARFEGTPFVDSSFSEADLSDAVFRYTNLQSAEFSETDLSGAEFRDVDFTNATFSGTDFTDSTFNGVTFSEATLTGEDLSGLDLSGETFTRASLDEANLVGADLSGRMTDLTEANLHDADLTGADLSYADLSNADLSNANLSSVNFRQSNLTGVDFANADLSDADLSNADITDADFSSANLSGAALSRIKGFHEADFFAADFSQQRLRDFEFTSIPSDRRVEDGPRKKRTTLQRADFSGADLSGADFRCADLRGAVFVRANCRYADFRRASVAGADFSNADLYRADCSSVNFHRAVFDGADCRYTDFSGSFLEAISLIETDLRSASFEDARIYRATFTACNMNAATKITESYLYDGSEDEHSIEPFEPHQSSVCEPDEGMVDSRTDDADGSGMYALNEHPEHLEKRAWVHEEIHRRLIKSGRVREAMSEKHYLKEQNVRTKRARVLARIARTEDRYLESLKQYGSFVNLGVMKWLLLFSAVPVYLVSLILLTAAGFALLHLLVGGLRNVGNAAFYTIDGLSVGAIIRIFAFSLVTILEGTYLVLKASIGEFIPLEPLEPLGTIFMQISGIDVLEPTGAAVTLVEAERAFGAVLLIPFILFLIQRAKLYIGSPLSEEGIGSGFFSWFLGR